MTKFWFASPRSYRGSPPHHIVESESPLSPNFSFMNALCGAWVTTTGVTYPPEPHNLHVRVCKRCEHNYNKHGG